MIIIISFVFDETRRTKGFLQLDQSGTREIFSRYGEAIRHDPLSLYVIEHKGIAPSSLNQSLTAVRIDLIQ